MLFGYRGFYFSIWPCPWCLILQEKNCVYISECKHFHLPDCGRNKKYVQSIRMTLYARLTSTQNRSRFLQAYTRYFLHCNKHFVHTFFNMVCLKPRDIAALKEYP